MKSVSRYLVSAALAIAMAATLSACGDSGPPDAFDGYLEADLVLVGAEQQGRIVSVSVTEGEDVELGREIALIDSAMSRADVTAAEARLAQAQARLADALASVQQPEEIAALEANLSSARTTLANAQRYFERLEPLAPDAIPAQELDNARAARDQARAQVNELQARIAAASSSARTDQIAAAEASVDEAEAALARAREALERYAVITPAAGRIEEIYYRPGEVVSPGQPVVALLPPGNLNVRFFVPETVLSSLTIGKEVGISCDGCSTGLTAEIDYIAREAEFTPPIILSADQRTKLVWRVEARPVSDTTSLPTGQPVTVSLDP